MTHCTSPRMPGCDWEVSFPAAGKCRYMSFHRIYIIAGDRPVTVAENVDLPVLKGISPDDHLHRRFTCRGRKRDSCKIRTPANKPAIIRFHIFVFNCFSPFGMCFDVFDLICPDVMCLDLMFDLFHDLNFRNVAKSPDILIQTFPSFFIFHFFTIL